ncbi:MAG: hypothetical protein JNK05_38720 [Myxococcales bacterium]|nr:hypothetical protein [Myxococcales bacterium]
MKLRFSSAFLFSIALCSARASAQSAVVAPPEPSLAARYSHESRSILGGGAITVVPSSSASLGAQTSLYADAQLRWMYRGWALSPRVGVHGGFAEHNATLAGNLGADAGFYFGTIRPVSDRVSLGALAGYTFSLSYIGAPGGRGYQRGHAGSLEVPVTIHLGRAAFIEPVAVATYRVSTIDVSSTAIAILGVGSTSSFVVSASLRGGCVF